MIHTFNHHAMATLVQVRIDHEEPEYAVQAARAAFELADRLESLLSRFREESEIRQIAGIAPGETLRLSEPVFACLEIAREMETVTRGAFCISPEAAMPQPRWSLDPARLAIRCEQGRLAFDPGAIGKGFVLDRMGAELAEWECPAHLLVAGGSSILAGTAPSGAAGWDVGLGEDHADYRCLLAGGSLSGSGVAVKGRHILDPRTGTPATRRDRAWVLAPTAAVSDALSTACMVLSETEIGEMMTDKTEWLALLNEGGAWRHLGGRLWVSPMQ
jgi:thiamine biosynthesis lipoprotein